MESIGAETGRLLSISISIERLHKKGLKLIDGIFDDVNDEDNGECELVGAEMDERFFSNN